MATALARLFAADPIGEQEKPPFFRQLCIGHPMLGDAIIVAIVLMCPSAIGSAAYIKDQLSKPPSFPGYLPAAFGCGAITSCFLSLMRLCHKRSKKTIVIHLLESSEEAFHAFSSREGWLAGQLGHFWIPYSCDIISL